MRTIIRAVIACVAMAGAMTCAAAVTSRSYVQQGLVAQYDGIKNAGHDAAHSDSATTWVDLTGNGNNGTCASQLSWSANGWSVSGDCKPVTLGNAISAVTASKNYTIQFACTPAQTSLRECFFSQYNGGNEYGIGIEHNDSSSTSGYLRFYSNGGGRLAQSNPFVAGAFAQGAITVSNDGKNIEFWKNGTSIATQTYSSEPKCNSGIPSVIGGEPWPSSNRTGDRYDAYKMAFHGTYNAFRIYGRVLTEEELKINAAVDAIRFNGASWEDYPELAAYSFAMDGTLQYSIGVEATAGGAVRLDDGAAAATAGAPFDYDGTAHSATFTAVPDSGYVFYRWEGDISAITDGSYLSPTITITSAKVFSLTAVFKATTRGLTSRSYVQDGLVAHFDGIDNTGAGSHDSSATTWTDLTDNGNNATKSSNASWNGTTGWTSSSDGKPMVIPAGNGSATTVAGTTAKQVFTAQFTVKPSRHNERQCFFGQWNSNGVSIEHNSGDSGMTGYMRAYYNYFANTTPDNKAADDKFKNSDVLVTANEWAAMTLLSDTAKQTIWKNAQTSQTIVKSLVGKLTNICDSVIGGDNSRGNMGFRGTYHAFRLYNRVLTENEVKFNAAIDDKRFNNGAKGLQLPSGWSFASDNTLMIAMTATATTGGKVALKRVGTFAASVSSFVNQDGTEITGFVAQSEEGYVFDRWTGDIDAIVAGSVLTPEIGVVATRPVSLTAVFRKPYTNALDGLVFDLDIRDVEDGTTMGGTDSGYHVGNLLKAGSSESNTYYKTLYTSANVCRPIYRFMDIASPMTPFTTNAAQACIYTPQSFAQGSTYNVGRWELKNNFADAPVATVYVRFLWEGSILPNIENTSCILCNGYVNWGHIGEGFALQIVSPANANKGFLNVFVPNKVPSAGTGTDLYITSNSWVDCFASIYPSPTNVDLSNADIWFCQTPALGNDGIFGYPKLRHRHIGDEAKLPKFKSMPPLQSDRSIRLGAETSGATDNQTNISKAFRGYYAGLKAWNRLLTENEMWSVMAGRYGGTFNVGVENGSADEFGGTWYGTADPFDVSANKWQEMKKSLTAADRTLTLVAPIPAESDGLPRVLEIVPLFDGVGATCPVTVAVNGVTVDTVDLMDASKRAIPIRRDQVKRDANGKITIAITRPEGCAGTLSFDALSFAGSWQIGTNNGASSDMTQQAQGVSSVVIAGDPDYKHAQRAVTTTYNTLTIPFDVPKSSAGQCAYRYETFMNDLKSGNTHPMHLEFNGETVWSSANATKGMVRVDIPAESIKSGLNELKWVYDTTTANNWISFDYHMLKMRPPSLGLSVIIK